MLVGVVVIRVWAQRESTQIRKKLESVRCSRRKKSKDCYVILVHIGGPARRGAGSDEVAKIVAPYADSIIVSVESNQDQFFDNLGSTNNVSVTLVESRNEAAAAIADIFN